MTDEELLQRFVADGSGDAFADVVGRHLNLVYSVARRQTGSPTLAEDVAQLVFIKLAQEAARIRPGTPLVAWLHVVTRRTASNAVREAVRRQAREAASALVAPDPMKSNWKEIEPLLDDAVESLGPTDRAAILLRFFENKSLRDVGAALKTSEDAAQKRVSRALEQLRTFLLQRGIAVTAAGLAADISAHGVEIAPAALGSTICAASATSLATAGAAEAARILTMTALQKTTVLVAFTLIAGVGVYQASLLARQSTDLTALRGENNRTAAELRTLQATYEENAKHLTSIDSQIDRRLAAVRSAPSPADTALEAQMREWATQVDRLHDLLARHPEWNIPELKLLSEDDWFTIASQKRYESEDDLRAATSWLRHSAINKVANRMGEALRGYARTHAGAMPSTPSELASYFDPPIDPAILERYKVVDAGGNYGVPKGFGDRTIVERQPADPENDSMWYIGTNAVGNSSKALPQIVTQAMRQYTAANGGTQPTVAAQLAPYLPYPVAPTAVQKQIDEVARRARR